MRDAARRATLVAMIGIASVVPGRAGAATPRPRSDVRMVRFAGGRLRVAGRGEPVTVAPFLIDATEVTVEAYAACVGAGACDRPGATPGCNDRVAGRDRHPVNCVTWDMAKAYCAWA